MAGGSGQEGEESGAKPKRRRRSKAELFPRNLPVRVEAVVVPAEVEADPDAYAEIGEEHQGLAEMQPARLYWSRTVLKKFVPKADRSRPPLKAPAPPAPVPGTLCGPRLAAAVVADKYCDHLPHYRQSGRLLRQHGAEIGRKTLNAWTHAVARHLAPVGGAVKAEMAGAEALQVDESPVEFLDPGGGKTSQGYLWVYRDVCAGTLYYDWQLGRGHDCLLDFLGYDGESGTVFFQGTLQCDGFSAYQALVRRYAGIKLAGCLAHIRRKFVEAAEQAPEAALRIILAIGELYRIEDQMRRGRPGRRRPPAGGWSGMARARPVADELKKHILAEKHKHLPQSAMGKAVTYALGQWAEMELYLTDGRLEIDNNLLENAIRPPKLGAKNYLFFGSAAAGEHSALFYTLAGNCKACGLDFEAYLAEVIVRAHHEDPAALTPAAIAAERAATAGAAA